MRGNLMKRSIRVTTALSLAAICGMAQTVRADSTDAVCEFYKHGEEKPNKSGDCTFSQRQGYIDINLRNGQTFNLSPAERKDHFLDQNDNRVHRSVSNNNTQEFKWDNKRIVVRFNRHDDSGSHQHGHDTSDHFGETPHKLRDLVGARAGQAEDILDERGYIYAKGESSGDSKYSYWEERSTGRCVTIRTADGRYQSIVYAMDESCQSR
jgi:hypothetical protein